MNRTILNTAIKEIKSRKLPSVHHVEELDLFHELNFKKVATGLDVDKHRWYEISTDVYVSNGYFIGIRGAAQLYSESSSWEDLYIETDAFEMEEVKTITYRRKK